jgi:hypothetical protein
MWANPGRAIYLLLARDFAPLAQRLRSVANRLACLPGALAAARSVLTAMPEVHIETALTQFAGTRNLIAGELAPLAESANGTQRELGDAMVAADDAIGEHMRRGDRLLRRAGPAGERPAADVHRRVTDASGLAGRTGPVLLPRVQPAFGAQPDDP